jgi:hypothetical protein
VNCSSVTNTFLTEAEAITAWNTRTDTERDELRAALEEIRKIADKLTDYGVPIGNIATQALDKAKERSNG